MDTVLRMPFAPNSAWKSWTSKLILVSGVFLFSLVSLTSASAEQPLVETQSLDLEQILASGKTLEDQGLWGEALGVYQSALKLEPSNEKLKTRRAVSRIHYDLGTSLLGRQFHRDNPEHRSANRDERLFGSVVEG